MALNFLVTGVKMLAKKMAKDKLKKKAKNFVQGKKDKKKDKRQVAKNIMQKESVYAGGGAIVPKVEPVSALVPSGGDKGGDSATIGSGDSGKTSFSALSETLDNIVGLTDGIATVSSGLKQQQQDELKTLDEQKKKRAKKAREAKLEKGDGQGKGIGKKIMKKAKGPLDFMTNFLVNIALGTLVLFLLNNSDKIKKSFEFIIKNWDKMMWVFRGVFLEISSGFPLLKSSFGIIGKATTKTLKAVATPFKAFGNLVKNGFTSLATRIGNWAMGGISKIQEGLQLAWKAVKNSGVGQFVGKNINRVKNAVTATKTAVTNTAAKAKDFVTGKVNKAKDIVKTNAQKVTSKIANKAQKVTQPLMKQASKVSGQAQKLAGKVNKPIKGGLKFIQKLMGPKTAQGLANNAKAMKPLAKASKGIKIPIIGPLLVAITSMLAGDPLGKTLFKALGAAAGGALGTLIPIPVIGTIMGEMLGEFVGDLLYEGFMGDGWAAAGKILKDKLMGLLSTGKSVLKWIGGGFGRFIENFKKDHMIKLPKVLGVQVKLPGIGDKIPNLLQLYNPMAMGPLLLKSFFPPGGEKEESNSAALTVTTVDTDVDAISTETDYEKSDGKTIIAEEAPTPPSGGGGGGGSKPIILAASTKDVVNSYNKSVVTGQLSKI